MQTQEEYIRRIAEQVAMRVVKIYGNGGGGNSSAFEAWVEENYINKKFFTSIFKVFVGYGSSATEIEPNEEMPTPDTSVNIQSVYGLWTEKFLSALGQGSGGGGGGGATALSQLTDVQLTSLAVGNLLKYDGTHWVNVTLTTLLNGYATETWVGNNFASATDNATQTWVNQQGFVKNHPTSFWGQNWPTTNSAVKGNMIDVGNITMDDGDRYIYFGSSNQNFYIKKISDRFIIKANGTEIINIYNNKLYVAAQIHSSVGVYSDGYMTALSDIRKKNVTGHFVIDVEKIASASLIRFTWKDRDDFTLHAGGIAQEWQKILPESVIETEDGTLAMDYGVIGVASAISLARKVQEQQREIDELKRKNAELEEKMNRIEKLIMEGRV